MQKLLSLAILLMLSLGAAMGQLAVTAGLALGRSAEQYHDPSSSGWFTSSSRYLDPQSTFLASVGIDGSLGVRLHYQAALDYQYVRLQGEIAGDNFHAPMSVSLRGHQIGVASGLSLENWSLRTFGCLGFRALLGIRPKLRGTERDIISYYPAMVYGPTEVNRSTEMVVGFEGAFGFGTHFNDLTAKWEVLGRLQGLALGRTEWLLGLRMTCALPLSRSSQAHHHSD